MSAEHTSFIESALRASGSERFVRLLAKSLGISKLRRRMSLKKYGAIDRFEAKIQGLSVCFSTEDPYSNQWFFPRYAGGKIHEESITELLLEDLKASKCFVDVGANLAWYTCLASKRMPNGIVYGFEMDSLNYALLQKNVSINECRNVMIYHAAVTDMPGRASYKRRSIDPRADFHLSSGAPETDAGAEISVEAISLDDFFEDKEVKPDVIKIDVEGAETKVLKGMKGIMKTQDLRLFVEVHPRVLPELQSSTKEVLSLLIDSGYEVFEIEGLRKHHVSRKLDRLAKDAYIPHNTMLYARKTRS